MPVNLKIFKGDILLFFLLFPFFIFIFAYFFPYFWAMAISSVISLNIKLKFQILLSVFLFVFVGFCAVYCYAIDTDHTLYLLFLAGYVIGTPLWVLHFYLNERTSKVRFYTGLVATLFIIWEMEVPQKIIFYNITKDKTMYDIEIVDDNYTLPVNFKRFSIGYADPYNDCVDDPSKCPLLPMPHQLKHYVDKKKNNERIIVANLYGPYYASTYLMLFFDTFKDGGGITYQKSFYIKDNLIFQYLENLKSENQKIKN